MRFTDRHLRSRPGTSIALTLVALLVVVAAAGARLEGPPKLKPIGGLTASKDATVKVGKTTVSLPFGGPKTTTVNQTYPLYSGETIQTTNSGVAWFKVSVGAGSKQKTLFCTILADGPDPGILTVAPNPNVVLKVQTGDLECATSAKGGQKTIMVQTVTLTTVDPVFRIVSGKKKVVVTLRSGAATVTGKDRKQGVVVGLTAMKGKQKVETVTIPVGGNPTQPTTVAAPPTAATKALEQKVPAPKPDTKPPVTTLTSVPANPSGQTQVPFTFSSDPGTLFSCSLNGLPYHACTSGQPQPVGPGQNTFSVEATDPAGNPGPPASYTWYTERSPSAPIVFMSDRTGRYELYTIDPDGTNLTPLTTTSGNFDPAWSPDGKKIAFESDRNQPKGAEIYVLTLADKSIQRLTTNPANDRTPKWSPDGKFIVFASDRNGGKYQIYRMAADGSSGNKPTQLTSGAENSDPSWSTDGKSIAFESTRDGNNEIYVMSADGSHETRLTKNTFGDFNPSWSPNGEQIVFESDRNRNNEIYLMDANGMNQQRLTFNKARDSNPTFSPDGSRIAWSSNRAGPVDIWVAALKGNGPTRLVFGGKHNLAPSW
jgi:hypothetical protein